jgi:hypothetical protein
MRNIFPWIFHLNLFSSFVPQQQQQQTTTLKRKRNYENMNESHNRCQSISACIFINNYETKALVNILIYIPDYKAIMDHMPTATLKTLFDPPTGDLFSGLNNLPYEQICPGDTNELFVRLRRRSNLLTTCHVVHACHFVSLANRIK